MDVKDRQGVSTDRAVILLLAAMVAAVTLSSCARASEVREPPLAAAHSALAGV